MLHHSTEYSTDNGSTWHPGIADEQAGSGKTLTITGLSSGSYQVRLRITPLTGGGPAVVSDACTLVVAGAATFASAIAGYATISAAITTEIRVAGSVQAGATTTADLHTGNAAVLGSAISAGATVTAAVTTGIPFAATVNGSATVTAPITTSIRIVSAITGSAVVSGAMTTIIRMAGAIAGSATAAADLTTGSAAPSAPTLYSNPGNTKNTIAFTVPSGATAIDIWALQSASDYSSNAAGIISGGTQIQNSGTTSPKVHISLTNGQKWWYTAKARNSGGSSSACTPVYATPSSMDDFETDANGWTLTGTDGEATRVAAWGHAEPGDGTFPHTVYGGSGILLRAMGYDDPEEGLVYGTASMQKTATTGTSISFWIFAQDDTGDTLTIYVGGVNKGTFGADAFHIYVKKTISGLTAGSHTVLFEQSAAADTRIIVDDFNWVEA